MAYAFQAAVTTFAATTANKSNFTALISISSARIATVANGGSVQHTVTRTYGTYGQVVPADLILSSDAAGLSLYNWGYDLYDPVAGTALIWVNIPTFSTAAFPTIYVSVGNAGVSTYQGGAIGSEFDAFTKAAYHFPDGAALKTVDFSAFGNNGTPVNTPTATAGKIDGAVNFASASSQKVTAAPMITAFPLTIGVWFKPVSGAQNGVIASLSTVGGGAGRKDIGMSGGNLFLYTQNDTMGNVFFVGSSTISSGVWQYGVAVFASAADYRLFYNGANKVTNTTSVTFGTPDGAYMGTDNAAGNDFNGGLDEVRYSSIARSDDWIADEYTNQNSPWVTGTFLPIGGVAVPTLCLLGCQ